MEFVKDKEVIDICPELLSGLPIPRPSAELVDGVVMGIDGKNVDKEYRYAVDMAMKKIEYLDIDLVILQSRSPTFRSLSQSAIYEAVWKENPEHCGSAVMNVVSQIRRKIGDGYIEIVVGSGYRFVE